MKIAKYITKKTTICMILTVLFVMGFCYVLGFSGQVKAQKGKVDTSLNKVNYTATESIVLNKETAEDLLVGERPNIGKVEALNDAIIKGNVDEIDGHKLIGEAGGVQLYMNEEYLSIILKDKESGAIMQSTASSEGKKVNRTWQSFLTSGIVLHVLKGINIVPTTVDLEDATKTITYVDNGFTSDIYYEKYGIRLQLNVNITEDGLSVEIPNSSIIEDSDDYKIGSVYVYPFLGNTLLGDREGYMFIPDGNGALVYLEDNEGRYSANFSQYVYGMNVGLEESYTLSLLWETFQTVKEADKIMAPIFGMVHTDSNFGFLGVIEGGQYSAKIEMYPNGAYTDYNWITSKFIVRQIYTQPTGKREGSVITRQEKRNEFDISLKYLFVKGEDANYTGLAKEYREYLVEEKLVKRQEDEFNIRLDFLGTDKEPWMIFKRNVVMTTTDNIREMYLELKDQGVEDILSIYKGWQTDGINSVPISKFSVEKDIGGKKELVSLMEDSEDMGIKMYLYQDALRVNPELKNANYNVMKQITKRVYEEWAYKYVFKTFRYLTPAKSGENLVSSVSSYKKEGIDTVALSGITNILFTHRNKNKVYDRTATANTYENMIAGIDGDMNLIMEQGFQYLWKYSDAIYDMPTTSSKYIFTDAEVPFFSIALKGIMPLYGKYINFEADKHEYFLQLVEMGINPSFYITYEEPSKLQFTSSSDLYSSKYSVYKDTIVEYYHELKSINDKVEGAQIVEHLQYSNGLTIVTYSNGVTIYINYNAKASISVNGQELAPMSYHVGGRNER